MVALGTGFDCASKVLFADFRFSLTNILYQGEIKAVLEHGIAPKNIIYANPCKLKSHIKYAKDAGIKMMTFDNADELYKIKEIFPDAELVLRILTDDSKAVCQLGLKFGAPMNTVENLLQVAQKLQLNVIGVR